MKKTSIITMQGVYNYGAVLQTVATCQVVRSLGSEPTVVDYNPPRMNDYGSLKQIYQEAMRFHHAPLKCMVIALLKYPAMKKAKKVFQTFCKAYIPLSRSYKNIKELKECPPEADIYMTGSDQVWNPFFEGGVFDEAYFLCYAPDDKKKVSFASSFGQDHLDVHDCKQFASIKKYLRRYDAISVREESGLNILKDIPVPKEAVLDPTLFLRKEAWKKYMTPIREKNYILIYQLHESTFVSELARRIGEKTGKKVIRISTDYFKRIKGGKTAVVPSVGEFLSYFKSADLVVTDSFHGTAFSINFRIPFISVPSDRFNSRINNILHKTGLEKQLAKDVNHGLTLLDASWNIDWAAVDQKLEEERTKSMEFVRAFMQ